MKIGEPCIQFSMVIMAGNMVHGRILHIVFYKNSKLYQQTMNIRFRQHETVTETVICLVKSTARIQIRVIYSVFEYAG